MRTKIWAIRILLILGALLVLPGATNKPRNQDRTPGDIENSMHEIARLQLSQLPTGSAIQVNTIIRKSKVGEDGPGPRFIQISLVRKGTDDSTPWIDGLLAVTASQNGQSIELKPTKTRFYLQGYSNEEIVGLALIPKVDSEFFINVVVSSSGFPKDMELLVAPNWPSAFGIKDQIVGAMMNPLFDAVLIWFCRIAFACIFVSILMVFRIPASKPGA